MPAAAAVTTAAAFPDGKRLVDYEPLAKVCASFLIELFDPESPSSTTSSLPYFIAMALAHAQLPDANALAALILLQRLKSHNPTFSLSSPPLSSTHQHHHQRAAERLFLSAYLVATKVLNDERYRMQFWVGVGQNKFDLDELSCMEKEFFEEVDWDVRIDDATLAVFELMIGCRLKLMKNQQQQQQQWDDERWGMGLRRTNIRSDSTESGGSLDSAGSGGGLSASSSSSSGEEDSCTASPVASPDSLPVTPSSLAVDISPMLVQIKRSKENITSLDKRMQELQEQYNALAQKSLSSHHHHHHVDAHQGTRGQLLNKFRNMFK